MTMDHTKLSSNERKVPFMQGRAEETCIHGNKKGMGCCGYDELAVKPATTTPITFGTRPRAHAAPKEEAEMGERPRIMAKPMAAPDVQLPNNQTIPVMPAMGGRIPDGNNMGVGAQVRSIFDVPKQPQPQLQRPSIQGQNRTRVFAKALGQEALPAPPPPQPTATTPPPAPVKPPPPPPEKIEAVLRRETPPEGLVKREALDLAAALTPALENSALALAEGEQCIGIDDSSLKKATGLRDGLLKFSAEAPENARLEIDPTDITLMEQVLDCSALYEAKKQAAASKTAAFVIGGLLIGGLMLALMSNK